MKKIAIIVALAVLVILLTEIANQIPPVRRPALRFRSRPKRVIECTPSEITLLDLHQVQTHLEKDLSWPECSVSIKTKFWISTCRGAKKRTSKAGS